MQEHHGPAKETDITSALVIFFAILVVVMIAKVAGDFTSQNRSTSARATNKAYYSDADFKPKCAEIFMDKYGKARGVYNQNDIERDVLALVFDQPKEKLITGADCGSYLKFWNTALKSDTRDGQMHNGGNIYPKQEGVSCCIDQAVLQKQNDAFCSRMNYNLDVKCRLKGCQGDSNVLVRAYPEYTQELGGTCDNVNKSAVSADINRCCVKPFPTSTPTPRP